MRFRALFLIAIGAMSLLVASAAQAQTCSGYSEVKPNGKLTQVFTSSATNDHVSFFFFAFAGRSYSVEVQNVDRNYQNGTLSMNAGTGNCPTADMAGLTDTSGTEPTPIGDTARFRRVSVTPSTTGFIQFRAGAASGTVALQGSVSETTLFSNWFFLGGDYSAYTLIRNTTGASVAYTINWRDGTGTIRGTVSATLSANGSTFVNARDFVAAVSSGTVEIVHNGTPGAIVASTTVLSATTGLSFDAPFAVRPAF